LSDVARLKFLQWGDGSSSPIRSVSLSSDTTLSVSYGTQYLETANVAPPGTGTVDPPGSVWRSAGDLVNITAFPSAGCNFTGWSGDLSGTSNPSQVVMDGPKNITANFQGQPVPEFPGPLKFLTILVGVFLALLTERRLRHHSIP
jgi:hypothetical protein